MTDKDKSAAGAMPAVEPPYHRYQQAVVERHKTFYRIDGVRYQRVTTPLGVIEKPGLVPWAQELGMSAYDSALLDKVGSPVTAELVSEIRAVAEVRVKRRESAGADLGTLTHGYVDRLINEGPAVREEVPPELLPAVDGALAWLEDYGIEVIATERTVWSEEDGIAGTFDVLGRDQTGRLVIADWKRAKGIYWEHELQLGAYAEYLHESTGHRADVGYVVRLPQEPVRDGGPAYGVKVIEDLETLYVDYLSAVRLYRARAARNRRREA